MDFGEALKLLKCGKKVARSGWNGKGMFVYMVSGSTIERWQLKGEAHYNYPGVEGGVCHDDKVKICPHIDMKAADGSIVVGWLASQTDMLAEDWMEV